MFAFVFLTFKIYDFSGDFQGHTNQYFLIFNIGERPGVMSSEEGAISNSEGAGWLGKRPDGATPIPRDKPLAWDITIPDAYALSYIDDRAARATAAADRAAANKIAKYTELNSTHHFTPIAIETGGAWNQLAIEFVSELGL